MMTEQENKEKTFDELVMVFVELKKFVPTSVKEKKMQVLWLRYLTEIDENTQTVDESLLKDENVAQALELVEQAAYTDAELLAIDKYWDSVSRERTALDEKFEKGKAAGHEEGRAEGRAEGIEIGEKKGRTEGILAVAANMKASGMSVEVIMQMTGLTEAEVLSL